MTIVYSNSVTTTVKTVTVGSVSIAYVEYSHTSTYTVYTVSGTVLNTSGVAMAGASVALYVNGSLATTLTTNSSGGYSYNVEVPSETTYPVYAVCGGISSSTITI